MLPVPLPSMLSPPYIPGSCSSLGYCSSISLPLDTSAHHSVSNSSPAPLYLSSCLFFFMALPTIYNYSYCLAVHYLVSLCCWNVRAVRVGHVCLFAVLWLVFSQGRAGSQWVLRNCVCACACAYRGLLAEFLVFRNVSMEGLRKSPYYSLVR